MRGHADMVTLLLEHGAELGARTDDGKSALDLAQEKRQAHIVRLLQS